MEKELSNRRAGRKTASRRSGFMLAPVIKLLDRRETR
jgi:hypothetical protein